MQAGGREFESLSLHCKGRPYKLYLENRIPKKSNIKKTMIRHPRVFEKTKVFEEYKEKDRDIKEALKLPGVSR